jgi:NADH:ubiquinone oxidoreductase subunit 4 (subunit M)
MLLYSLLLVPFVGIFLIYSFTAYENKMSNIIYYKSIALITSIINLIISLIIYILFDFSSNQFQFVQEQYNLSFFNVYLGIDGISIYFILLTTLIVPIAILSN